MKVINSLPGEMPQSRLYNHSPHVIQDFSMYEATIVSAVSPYKKRDQGSAYGRKHSNDNFKSSDSTKINSVVSPTASRRVSLMNGGSMQMNQ